MHQQWETEKLPPSKSSEVKRQVSDRLLRNKLNSTARQHRGLRVFANPNGNSRGVTSKGLSTKRRVGKVKVQEASP